MSWGTPVGRGALFDTANGPTVTLAGVAFTSGRLYLAFYTGEGTGGLYDHSTMAISGQTGSWTFISQTTSGVGANARRISAWYYIATATETVSVVFDPPGGNKACNAATIIEIPSGFDSTTPIAQNAPIEMGTGAGTFTVNLTSAPSASNMSVVGVMNRNNSFAIGQDAGFTGELSDIVGSGTSTDSGDLEVSYKSAATQNCTVSAGSGTPVWGGIHLELQAAAAASPQTVNPGGISSAEAFGVARIGLAIVAAGAIASGQVFGAPTLNLELTPSGLASGEAFGVPMVGAGAGPQTIGPSGITSLEAFGTSRLAVTITPAGVTSAQVFGQPHLNLRLAPAGIASATAFGMPLVGLAGGPQTITPAGIASAGAFGAARLGLHIGLAGAIGSSQAFGSLRIGMHLGPSGIVSREAFGVPAISSAQTVAPPGIASLEAFGGPIIGGALTGDAQPSNIFAAPAQDSYHLHPAQPTVYIAPALDREDS